MGIVDFHNTTALPDARLRPVCAEAAAPWAVGRITLRIRYSRGADFSGTCFYADRRIFVNVGRHLRYPYRLRTNLAKARTSGRYWYRPVYTLDLADGCQLALFIFLHELYHLLVKRARRNTRQKESMCDRFAARYMVTRFGRSVRDSKGAVVPRRIWDFQDLEGFVAAARDRRCKKPAATLPEPARAAAMAARRDERQLTLF